MISKKNGTSPTLVETCGPGGERFKSQTPGSALFKYCKYKRPCTKGVLLKQACTKCMYKRHNAIKHELDIHEAGDKAIEKYM
jgi:hypothetical protein